jgi:phenylalanyl-tRNA synthetase beta chain
MKTSIKWLKDYIDFDFSLQEFSDHISLAGLEVETIEAINKIDEHIVVGEILSREKHPDADKLSVCEVSDGSEVFQVVCGAPNCDIGNRVPFAKIGADFGGGFVIKKSKLRGVKSFGMLCSASELNLPGDSSGLMILGDEFKVGTKLQDYYDFDYMVETEVTPNRPDWLSQTGIARELAAIVDSSYRMPEIKLEENSETITDFATVEVTAKDLCPRYTARIIKNIKIGPSPDWMQKYLTAVGLRPINNVVDITNFVLMELGQPLMPLTVTKFHNRNWSFVGREMEKKCHYLMVLPTHSLLKC